MCLVNFFFKNLGFPVGFMVEKFLHKPRCTFSLKVSRIFCRSSGFRLPSLFSTYLLLPRKMTLNPSLRKVSAIFQAFLAGGCSAIFVTPARSAKGLYFAITAINSTNGVPASGKVSRTSLCPSPIVRYFGCTTTRIISDNKANVE